VSYSNIEGLNPGDIVERSAFSHIKVPQENDSIWTVIETQLSLFTKRYHNIFTPEAGRAVTRTCSKESTHYLISGTTNLINTIIDRHCAGNDTETLLFMDKSARNGAFLFDILWKAYSKLHLIPEIKKPTIRFLNISGYDYEKHKSPASLALLKQKLHQKDFSHGVLVVDEFVCSGDSLKLAVKVIDDLFNSHPDGVQQFEYCPHWYGKSGLLGVTDSFDQYDETFEKIGQLPTDQILNINTIINTIGEDQFGDLTKRIIDKSGQIKLPNPGLTKVEINLVKLFISQSQLEEDEIPAAVAYFRTAGGFLVSPQPEKTLKDSARAYRSVLRQICDLYLKNQTKKPSLSFTQIVNSVLTHKNNL